MINCKIKHCNTEIVNNRGWCAKHYMKWYRHGDPLWAKRIVGRTPTKISWTAMKQRCSNRNAPDYDRYGGRAIKYDKLWENFEYFLKDMGERPAGMTLDRKDVNGNYSKNNCRWATPLEQSNNQRITKFIEWRGQTKTITGWAVATGIPNRVIRRRICENWSVERALTEAVNKTGPKN